MKKTIAVLGIAALLLIFACSKDGASSKKEADNPVAPRVEQPLTASIPLNGTWSSNGSMLTMVTLVNTSRCACTTAALFPSCTFIQSYDTASAAMPYVLTADSCYLYQVDTLFAADTADTVVRQMIYKLRRTGPGTGLAGEWLGTALPEVTYLKGAPYNDSSTDLRDIYRNPDEWASMKTRVNLDSGGTLQGTQNITLEKPAADYLAAEYTGVIMDTVEAMFPFTELTVTAVDDTTLRISDTALADPFFVLFSGTAPDMTISLSYRGLTSSYYLLPESQAECDAQENMGPIMQLMLDLGTAYPAPKPRK